MTKDEFDEIIEDNDLFFSIRHTPHSDPEAIDPLHVTLIDPSQDEPLAKFDIRTELTEIFSDDPEYYKAAIIKTAKGLRDLANELEAILAKANVA